MTWELSPVEALFTMVGLGLVSIWLMNVLVIGELFGLASGVVFLYL